MTCQHINPIIVIRRGDKYGQNVRVQCACGKIATNWHTEEYKARIAFDQNREDA